MPCILKEPLPTMHMQCLLYLDILWSTTVRDARSSPTLLLKLFFLPQFVPICFLLQNIFCSAQSSSTKRIFPSFVSECNVHFSFFLHFYILRLLARLKKIILLLSPTTNTLNFLLWFGFFCNIFFRFLVAGEQRHCCKRSSSASAHLIHLLIQRSQVPLPSQWCTRIKMPA